MAKTLTIAILLLVMLGCGSGQAEQAFITKTPEQIPFDAKADKAPIQTILYGDPSKPGLYVLRVHFPPGAHSNPHFHSQDRHITVIEGIWWMGTGKELDFNKAVPLKAGSYAFHPASGVHWDGAGSDQDATVQIVGIGPVETTAAGESGAPPGYWPLPK